MDIENEIKIKLKGTPQPTNGKISSLNNSNSSTNKTTSYNGTPNYSRSKKGTISSINFQKVTAGAFMHNDRTIKPNYLIDDISRNEFDLNSTQAKEKLSKLYEEAKTNFHKTYNQKLQAKSYIWEAVVNLKPTHNLSHVQSLVKELERETKFTSIQIAVHKDEGHINDRNVKEYNNHAHIVFFTLDKNTGQQLYRKSVSKSDKDKGIEYPVMNRDRLRKLQDITANSLGMERGVSVEITKRKRLSHKQYKEQQKELENKKGKYKEVILHQQAKLKDLKLLMKNEREKLKEQKGTRSDYAKLEQLNKDLQEQIRNKEFSFNDLEKTIKKKLETINYQNELLNKKDKTIKTQKQDIRDYELKEHKQELHINGEIPRKRVKIKDGLLSSKEVYIYETEAVENYISKSKNIEKDLNKKIKGLENENSVLKEQNLELDMFKLFAKKHFKSSNLDKVMEVIKQVVPKVEKKKSVYRDIKRKFDK